MTALLESVSPHLVDVVRPLSKATLRFIAPDHHLLETDRLHISTKTVSEDTDRFVMVPHSIVECGECNGTGKQKIEPEFPDLPLFANGTQESELICETCKGTGSVKGVASSHANYRWWQRIPGAHNQPLGYGSISPITDTTVLCTLACWGKERIMFEDRETAMQFWTKFAEFHNFQKAATHYANFKMKKELPADAPTGRDEMPPMPHQPVAAKCLIDSKCYNLFMEMRTGKTYSVIMAMDHDCVENPGRMNLVICPRNVRINWHNEIRKCTTKNVNVVQLRGGKLRRIKLLLEAFEFKKDYDYTVVIVSYEGLKNTINQIGSMKWRFGIADESHYFKWYGTKRWKALKVLRDNCEKRTGLTGTAICNSAMDLYTQFEWLGEGMSGFSSYDAFFSYYAEFAQGKKRRRKMRLDITKLPLIQERLARTSFRYTFAEACPDLPPVTRKLIEVDMTPFQTDVYNKVASEIYAEIERDLAAANEKNATITVTNILTRLLRLAQITSGFVAVDGEVDLDTGDVISHQIDHFDPNPKMEELVEYLKNRRPGSKTLVWACFVPNIKLLRARMEIEGIKCVTMYGKTPEKERDEIERVWNSDPSVTVLIGNPAVGGVGKNFNGACFDENGNRIAQCDSIVYYSQGWSHPVRVQSEARPRDKNTTWSVEIVDMLVLNSIDFEIMDRVQNKVLHAMTVQDVREMLGRLAGTFVEKDDE